jgi:predicted AAA+ superfamily ATPase
MFGAVLVVGPRQTGKTTMLRHVTEGIEYVTLDDPIVLMSAKEHSVTFFKDHVPPVFIDEIQKAPELFPQIKIIIDRDRVKGHFFMSGSQQFQVMKGVSESLAGRLGLITLLGYSLRERYDVNFTVPFIPTDNYFKERKNHLADIPYNEVWEIIQRGSMPELFEKPEYDWQLFYSAYVQTYVERDVRELSDVGDAVKFVRFMTAAAASTGQLINLASLARNVGISQPTADRWLSVLVASNIVYLLKPYFNNITKRAVKTPKLYFLDTGLAAYLTKWNTAETLKNGAMAGAFFETFVISEIIKSYYNKGVADPPLYFYRDRDMNEIDLLIEENGYLHPIEIKKHADPKKKDIKAFSLIDKIPGVKKGSGGIICLYDRLSTISDNDRVIPIQYI